MARSKKTVEVKDLLEFANGLLAMPETDLITTGYKIGVITMLEKALHKSGNYEGFWFLDSDDCDAGTFGYYSRKYYSK